jgi:hypothetical protein
MNLHLNESDDEEVIEIDDLNDSHFEEIERRSSMVIFNAKRRMTLDQQAKFDENVVKMQKEITTDTLKKVDSLHFLNEIVKKTVDEGTRKIKCPRKRESIVHLRPIEMKTSKEVAIEASPKERPKQKPEEIPTKIPTKIPKEIPKGMPKGILKGILKGIPKGIPKEPQKEPQKEFDTLAYMNDIITSTEIVAEKVLTNSDTINKEITHNKHTNTSIRLKTLKRVQRQMSKFHPYSFSSIKEDINDLLSSVSTKSVTKHLRQQLRKINAKLHSAFRHGHTRDIDIWSKKLNQTNKDLLMVSQKMPEAELGAAVSLLHQTGNGTSKRHWKQVHTIGAKWLEKTREHRSYRQKVDRTLALLPGTVKARRSLSPLLREKVSRMKLQSEIDMEKFSYCHHRINRPNGSLRGIAFHV